MPTSVPNDPYATLLTAVAPERGLLLEHPVYHAVSSPEALRAFMEVHVFAVWDFMSLLKSLQRKLTCVTVPWTPPRSRTAARLINEIVLGEESDEIAPGITMSHFELYLDAMREVGADTAPIKRFVTAVGFGARPAAALDVAYLPFHARHARRFVEGTLATATEGSVEAMAASFLVGREDLVPDMFRQLLPAVEHTRGAVSLRRYLTRHIEVDEGEHGPLARRLLSELCGQDASRWRVATEAARTAVIARIALWDGVVGALADGIVVRERTAEITAEA